MEVELQVIRDGETIFSEQFPAPTDRGYGDITALALGQFHIAHPDVLLTDDDVILKWAVTKSE